jgi:small subunit ribosomal protein S16
MLKIRLKRVGRQHLPIYQIVVMENLDKRDGKFIDKLGTYNPIKKELFMDFLKLKKYLIYGAKPTNTVRHLIYKLINNRN